MPTRQGASENPTNPGARLSIHLTFLQEYISCPASAQNCLRLFVCLCSAKLEHVSWLAFQRLANFFQSIESNSMGFVFLQAPESRMTNAGFFGQPIERPLMLFQ